ncbi:unnamed protein product [Choristocarpus tenellus]
MYITNCIVNDDLRPVLPKEVFQTLRILIEQCWDPAPALRPNFTEILEFLDTIARDEIVDGQRLNESPKTTANLLDEQQQVGQVDEHSEGFCGDMTDSGEDTVEPTHPPGAMGGALPVTVGPMADLVENPKQLRHTGHTGKKRGKNFRPVKGYMAREFLERRSSGGKWKADDLAIPEGDDEDTADEHRCSSCNLSLSGHSKASVSSGISNSRSSGGGLKDGHGSNASGVKYEDLSGSLNHMGIDGEWGSISDHEINVYDVYEDDGSIVGVNNGNGILGDELKHASGQVTGDVDTVNTVTTMGDSGMFHNSVNNYIGGGGVGGIVSHDEGFREGDVFENLDGVDGGFPQETQRLLLSGEGEVEHVL